LINFDKYPLQIKEGLKKFCNFHNFSNQEKKITFYE